MKKVKNIIAIVGFIISLLSCAEANTHPVIPPPEAPEEPADRGCLWTLIFPEPVMLTPLAGTQWELVGSVEVETGELTVYQYPEECIDCYSLDFDTDSTATFHGIINQRIDLFHLDTCMILQFEDILFDPPLPPEKAVPRLIGGILLTIGSYDVSEKELLLYYYFYFPYSNAIEPSLCYLFFIRKDNE